MIEKNIILGQLQSGLKKDTGMPWGRVNYFDLDENFACLDYFDNFEDFQKLLNKKIPSGSKCIGYFSPNSRRLLVLTDAKKI